MAKQEGQEYKNSSEIAKMFGVTERRVQQLAKEGIIPAASLKPYRFELYQTVQTYIRHLTDKLNGREEKKAGTTSAETDKLRAEADLKQSKARIAELQLKELEGQMHRSEDVEEMTNDLVYTVRSMILALPGRLAMDMAQTESAAEASAIIRAECHKILDELAGYRYDPEAYRKRVREREGWSEILAEDQDG